VKRAAALLACLAVSGCASGRIVRLEKDVEELRESLAQADLRDGELKRLLEELRQQNQALQAEVARLHDTDAGRSGPPSGSGLRAGASQAPLPAIETPTAARPASRPAEEVDLEAPEAVPPPGVALVPPTPRTDLTGPAPPLILGPESSVGSAGGSGDDGSMLGSADDLYAEAFANFQKAAYHKAILQFNVFVERYPQHDLTDNAFYWMGECWYGLRNYPRAIAAFDMVLERFPKGNKAPDSLLKKAYSLQRSGKPREAMAACQELLRRYPQSSSASKAQSKIKELEESRS
jgi:tol-pal system protein YbgF